jgi:hypothetical protein
MELKFGQIFRDKEKCKFMLCQVGLEQFSLIDLEHGNRYREMIRLDYKNVDRSDFIDLMGATQWTGNPNKPLEGWQIKVGKRYVDLETYIKNQN